MRCKCGHKMWQKKGCKFGHKKWCKIGHKRRKNGAKMGIKMAQIWMQIEMKHWI